MLEGEKIDYLSYYSVIILNLTEKRIDMIDVMVVYGTSCNEIIVER
jgi:hypothetical protein